jgi:hypothetical protein
MSGHWICDSCGCEWMHAAECAYLRGTHQWMGNRKLEDMQKLSKKDREKLENGEVVNG